MSGFALFDLHRRKRRSSYLTAQNIGNFQNPGTTHGDAIVQLEIDTTVTRKPTAVVSISHGSFSTAMRLINIP